MIDDTLLADLLRAQHQNQLALGSAIEELAIWAEASGGAQAAQNARNALKTLDDTQVSIETTLSNLP